MNIPAIIAGVVAFFVGGFTGAGIAENQGQQWGQNDDVTQQSQNNGQGVRAGQSDDWSMPIADDFVSNRPLVDTLPMQDLSQDEKDGLLYMREEEKLARDVYSTLYDKWQLPVFTNIAQSEQTHTESVRNLLDKYELTDPVTDDSIGVFVNSDLQALYNNLVAEGSQSVEAALRVGATIEDLDIKDLQDRLARTDNEDIALVYNNLERGSRNHLRSFVKQLTAYGATYEPQYISVDDYNSIVTSNREAGDSLGGQNGNGQGMTGGRGWGQGKNR